MSKKTIITQKITGNHNQVGNGSTLDHTPKVGCEECLKKQLEAQRELIELLLKRKK